jgi:hypothetical protein
MEYLFLKKTFMPTSSWYQASKADYCLVCDMYILDVKMRIPQFSYQVRIGMRLVLPHVPYQAGLT